MAPECSMLVPALKPLHAQTPDAPIIGNPAEKPSP